MTDKLPESLDSMNDFLTAHMRDMSEDGEPVFMIDMVVVRPLVQALTAERDELAQKVAQLKSEQASASGLRAAIKAIQGRHTKGDV